MLGILPAERHNSCCRMSTVLLEQLEEVGLDKEPRKVICQTYSGANVMREDTIAHHLIK